MTALLAALIGLLAGLHAATWGMYKDAPHEGFSFRTYLRSPFLGTALGVLVQAGTALDPRNPANIVVLFGAVYAVERAISEIYKTFVREEDQAKYFIPMQFHVLGRVVHSRSARLIAGCLYTALLVGSMVLVSNMERSTRLDLIWVIAIGSLGGWISAFGGAWKDAPSEGFQLFKFFRSPALATAYAFGLSYLAGSIVAITLAATGYTVATTETYKTFFFPDKPRGKFAGRPVLFPEVLRWRQRFVPLYVAIWMAVAGSLIAALGTTVQAQEPRPPLRGRATGVSMDRFSNEGSALMAMSYRFSTLRPGALGADVRVSLFPQALPSGILALAPDLGASYNISVPGGSLLLKAGGSAITAIGTEGVYFVPGVHLGGALILQINNRSGARIDVTRHYYRPDRGQVGPIWSVGLGFAILPRKCI